MSTKPAAGPWISVKERLPKHGVTVLGWNDEYGPFTCLLPRGEITDDGRPIWAATNLRTGSGCEPYILEYDDEWPTHWAEINEPDEEGEK